MTRQKVMISLNVSTMKKSAEILKEFLIKEGFDVWTCMDIAGGEEYRDEIVTGIKSSYFFIPLMNEEWGLSGECKDEYLLARRLNLTSHESGKSKRGEAREPIFVPIAFSGLNWKAHSHIELLAASTNFIVHDDQNLECGNTDRTLNLVLRALKKVSSPSSLNDNNNSKHEQQQQQESKQQQQQPQSSHQKLLNIQSDLVSLSMALQEVLLSKKSNDDSDNNNNSDNNNDPIGQEVLKWDNLRERYFGIVTQKFSARVMFVYSCELSLKTEEPINSDINILKTHGEIRYTIVCMRNEKGEKIEGNDSLSRYLNQVTRLAATGTFDKTQGLLNLKETKVIESIIEGWDLEEYRLVINPEGTVLYGVQSGAGTFADVFRLRAL